MMVGIIGIVPNIVGVDMSLTRYLCLECDMWKKRGTIFRDFKFICSDCDITYWIETKKWSNDGRVYYANISTKSTEECL